MFMNRKTDYAIRILRGLLDGQRHAAAQLAAREEIPLAFAYKILKQLSNAGIVRLERGPGGGCMLQADLKQVTLYDLVVLMEGDADITACMSGTYDCEWRRTHGICKVHLNLCSLQQEINQKLQAKSLWAVLGKSN